MNKVHRKSALYAAIVAIGVMWLLTATWGSRDADREFDRQFAFGHVGLGGERTIAITRMASMNPGNLEDPANQYPDGPWRYRGFSIAVAPFVLVDEVA